jgi:hypothetical protein
MSGRSRESRQRSPLSRRQRKTPIKGQMGYRNEMLAESHHRFDDAEHRLRGLLAQSVELFALRCPQTPGHGFDRCRVFRRRRRRGKPLAPGGMMRLPPGRNQRLDVRRLMALDRRGPRQSDLWSASPSGKSPFLLVRSDRDQHVIALILASTVIVKSMKSGRMRPEL